MVGNYVFFVIADILFADYEKLTTFAPLVREIFPAR